VIGNDIVDLKTASLQSNWRRRGFLEKLFNEKEQQIILSSSHPENQLWTLWAMKESAYKAHQRRFNLPRKFDPINFSATPFSGQEGKVLANGSIYSTRVSAGPDYIHCIAKSSSSMKVISNRYFRIQDMKGHFIDKISELRNLPKKDLQLQKDSNFVPYLTYKEQYLALDFSFSHHGDYSAFALALTNC
jgi:phosphopantetheine--protein transferase-like protein